MERQDIDQSIQLGGVTLRRQHRGWCALAPYYLCARPSPRGRPLKVELGESWTKVDLLSRVAPQLAPEARQRFEQALEQTAAVGPGAKPASGKSPVLDIDPWKRRAPTATAPSHPAAVHETRCRCRHPRLETRFVSNFATDGLRCPACGKVWARARLTQPIRQHCLPPAVRRPSRWKGRRMIHQNRAVVRYLTGVDTPAGFGAMLGPSIVID